MQIHRHGETNQTTSTIECQTIPTDQTCPGGGPAKASENNDGPILRRERFIGEKPFESFIYNERFATQHGVRQFEGLAMVDIQFE